MKVKAIAMGQYGNAIKECGDVFDIKPELFSSRWMVKIEEPKAGPVAPKDEDRRTQESPEVREAIGEQLKAEKLGGKS